jgi:Domain of unknown function (DUF4157)
MNHSSTHIESNPKTAKPNVPFFAPAIQKKMSVGASNDSYEVEADIVADKVMKMQDTEKPNFSHSGSLIQKKCTHCHEEEERIRKKPLIAPTKQNVSQTGALIQKKCAHCEEELRRKPLAVSITPLIQRVSSNSGTESVASDGVTSQINSSRGGGSKMDYGTQHFMESRFGTDFSGVRIHTGSQAVQMSRELNAQAFTVGNDVYFNDGKYSPNTNSGKHLLAHELTHTVQQTGGIGRKIQKFDSPEHIAVGDAGGQSFSGNILLLLHTRDLPNRTSPVSQWSPAMQELFNNGTAQQKRFMQSGLTYGEVVALSGDFYETADHLYRAPIREVYTLLPLISGHATTQQLENATGGRYMRLAERNDSHFSITASGHLNNMQTWKQGHIRAISQAMSGNLDMAYMINASADHYLTDRFASGHLLTPRTDFSTTGSLSALLHHDIDNQYGVNVTNTRGDSWVAYGDEMWNSAQNSDNRRFATEAVEASARDILVYSLYRGTSTPVPTNSTLFVAESIVPQISTASPRVTHTFERLSTAIIQRGVGYLSGAIQEIHDAIGTIGTAIAILILDARNSCYPANWIYHNMPDRGMRHLNMIGNILSSIPFNGNNVNNLLTSLTRPLSSFNMDAVLVELAADITTAINARGTIITVTPTEIRNLTLLRLVELLNLSGIISYNRPPHDLSLEQMRELS